jgi:hypothetical protein
MKLTWKPKIASGTRGVSFAAIGLAAILLGSVCPQASAATYAIELLAAQGTGVDVNDTGTVVGIESKVGFCPAPYPSCFSSNVVSVWPPGTVKPVALPAPQGLLFLSPRAINSAGWIAGTASIFDAIFRPQPVVWRPNGIGGYTAHELGLLPGNTISRVAGIDDLNRVVGYDTISDINPPDAAPFLWDPVGGLQNLATRGFPNEIPLAVSPKGTVALTDKWYRLDGGPQSVRANAPLPPGFVAAEASADINDKGDQARFLIASGSQSIAYFYRYVVGTRVWQQLSQAGTGRLSRYGIGSIDIRLNVTGTVQGSGVIAAGRSGLAQTLTSQVSPAYGGVPVIAGGGRNASGRILAQVMFGRSPGRLALLVPILPCATSCVRIATLKLTAKLVTTCRIRNEVSAALTVTDELGRRLPGVAVSGRFLDDYWLDRRVSGITDPSGVVRFIHRGPGCVGAIAFLAESAKSPGRVFDRTQGALTTFVIPGQ